MAASSTSFRHRIHQILGGIRWFLRMNWPQTLWINFRVLPFSQAIRLPIWVYGPLYIGSLKGKITFEGPLTAGRLTFGQMYESRRRHAGIAQFTLLGELRLQGRAFFGMDTEIFIGQGAVLEMGDYARMNSFGRLFCHQSIYIGKHVAVGFESVVSDSNFHALVTLDGEKSEVIQPIYISDYNYIGHRVSVLPGTHTALYTTISSLSLTNKDYRPLGTHLLLGGIPAKKIRDGIARDFAGEKPWIKEWFSPFNK